MKIIGPGRFVQSSAKRRKLAFIHFVMSFTCIYNRNNTGPEIDPYGTPDYKTGLGED